ncbi:MAG: hypothetical protein EU542_06730 [Promethearchaeota archaeon]|nr:MAG: hypothetical protein EU542_06730 [Candidatus Lokiarchaeota archaeon]
MVKTEANKSLLDLSYCLEKALKLTTIFSLSNENSILYQKNLAKKTSLISKILVSLSFIYMIACMICPFLLLIILSPSGDIQVSIILLLVILGTSPAAPILLGNKAISEKIAKFFQKRKAKREINKIDVEINKNDTRDEIINQSLETAFEDDYLDKVIFVIISEIATEIVCKGTDELKKDQLKRLVFTIISGTFVLESLELDQLVYDERLETREQLLEILSSIEFVLSKFVKSNKFSKFKSDFKTIQMNLTNITEIIQLLVEISQSKDQSIHFDELTTIIKEQIKDQPLAKSKIDISERSLSTEKDIALSSITALDSDVIEIRTKAGTYYTHSNHFQKQDLEAIRELELLTDKELEVKIEVIESTLNLLEEDKTLPAKEKKQLKENYLKKLLTAEQTLKKRKSASKTIVCPYCNNETSLIKRTCSQCGAELPLCMICLNAIGVNEEIKVCPHCRNIAHAEHFDTWLEKSNHCPVCKKRIEKNLTKIAITDKKMEK